MAVGLSEDVDTKGKILVKNIDWRAIMNSRIVVNPEVCGGEPCIRGTRIPVHIALSHLATGEDEKTILKNSPRITPEDILSCLNMRRLDFN